MFSVEMWSDRFEQGGLAGFDDGNDLLAFDRGESVKEVLNGFAASQIINQVLEWNTGAHEDRRAPHDLRIRMNDAFEFFKFHGS